jgi:spartin
MAMHPAYKDSRMVSSAAAASRLIVTTSSLVAQTLQSQADSFTRKTKPDAVPMTFTPTTHARVRKINTFTDSAAGLSAKTVGSVTKFAQNIGAGLTKKGERDERGLGPDGKPDTSYKPGLLNKSLMAFSTIADGIDQASRGLLAGTSSAATTVVGHKYGSEAGELTRHLSGGVQNVGLVYIDATGVSRRAIIKSVAKGMVVGKVRGGGDLVVYGGEAGVVAAQAPPSNWKEQEALQGRYADGGEASGNGGNGNGEPRRVAFGRRSPPSSGNGVGESNEGQKVPVEKHR